MQDLFFGVIFLVVGLLALFNFSFRKILGQNQINYDKFMYNLFKSVPIMNDYFKSVMDADKTFLSYNIVLVTMGLAATIVGTAVVLDYFNANILNNVFMVFFKP